VAPGWQQYDGQTVMPVAGAVAFSLDYMGQAIDDDGIDFLTGPTAADVIDTITMIDGYTIQKAVLEAYLDPVDTFSFPDVKAAANAVNTVFSELDVTLKPLNGGPFDTVYDVAVTSLAVPKTIDLEAPAA
jgi:hypothetical protein